MIWMDRSLASRAGVQMGEADLKTVASEKKEELCQVAEELGINDQRRPPRPDSRGSMRTNRLSWSMLTCFSVRQHVS